MGSYTDDHKYAHVRLKWEVVWETHLCKKNLLYLNFWQVTVYIYILIYTHFHKGCRIQDR